MKISEDERYLTSQLVTYIGNKRALLDFIGVGVEKVCARLNRQRISALDLFSGSGVVSRYLKKHADHLIVNDLERYAQIINRCYLANSSMVDQQYLLACLAELQSGLSEDKLISGFITELYSPGNMESILAGERCFYTPRNARYIDTARQLIGTLPESIQPFFLGPLLSAASVHANTSGVFKGFYKNSHTGRGQFGGNRRDALNRIMGEIALELPLLSRFESQVDIYREDANLLVSKLGSVDLAYLDPPYNQHPYGSNYFMLNLIADYVRPEKVSSVSGIPNDWQRSVYNQRTGAIEAMGDLVDKIAAKYLLISFNSEGFIGRTQMLELLSRVGKTEVLETRYNTFRGSRNLSGRQIHLKEYLYLVEKF